MRLFNKNTLLKHSDIPSHRKSFLSRWYNNFFGTFHVRRVSKANTFVEPDEIFIDSTNLPNFDTDQFEGRLEKPISRSTIYVTGGIFLLIGLVFAVQSFKLQLLEGDKWRTFAEKNRLNKSLIFAERGVIQDRNGVLLAWNQIDEGQKDYPLRKYRDVPGTHNLIGYVKYPKKDTSGFYYNTEYAGADGIEEFFEHTLKGVPGIKLTETDVQGDVISENVMRPAQKGKNITLTLDARVQEFMYDSIKEIANRSGFLGGAGMIMDIHTGEVIASVSYPEYDSNVMTYATNTALIKEYLADKRKPFLDRVSQGLYTPGSIVKPIFALAALQEKIISPDKQIESTGELRLPNPYRPGEYSIFKDWKAHGFTDMREAIAVSSDVYFYQIGGGFLNQQKGLGISKIDYYSEMFGLGEAITEGFFKGKAGIIPTPEWKARNFNGDIWRVGDTYNTSIGQYGYQVTPTQAIRSIVALANNGTLIDPYIFKSIDEAEGTDEGGLSNTSTSTTPTQEASSVMTRSGGSASSSSRPADIERTAPPRPIAITNPDYYRIVNEGMRMTVTDGTMKALNVPYVKIAGKTGTAQQGVNNEFINSWVTGFFPYEQPRYAFLIMMERGPSNLIFGATAAMVELVGKMNLYTPQYFKVE
jgi:penicillin-binding protein 2